MAEAAFASMSMAMPWSFQQAASLQKNFFLNTSNLVMPEPM